MSARSGYDRFLRYYALGVKQEGVSGPLKFSKHGSDQYCVEFLFHGETTNLVFDRPTMHTLYSMRRGPPAEEVPSKPSWAFRPSRREPPAFEAGAPRGRPRMQIRAMPHSVEGSWAMVYNLARGLRAPEVGDDVWVDPFLGEGKGPWLVVVPTSRAIPHDQDWQPSPAQIERSRVHILEDDPSLADGRWPNGLAVRFDDSMGLVARVGDSAPLVSIRSVFIVKDREEQVALVLGTDSIPYE